VHELAAELLRQSLEGTGSVIVFRTPVPVVPLWQERIGGIYSASPVAADGKIYLFNESGETVVLSAERKPHIL
jgi:hypothetical protein